MFGSTIGPAEIAIVLLLALVIFGPKKLPELGQGLGRGMRDFKRAVSGDDEGDERPDAPVAPVQLVQPTPAPVTTLIRVDQQPAAVADPLPGGGQPGDAV